MIRDESTSLSDDIVSASSLFLSSSSPIAACAPTLGVKVRVLEEQQRMGGGGVPSCSFARRGRKRGRGSG